MRKRCVYAIQLVLSLVIITALTMGCAGAPSTSTPGSVTNPSSKSTLTPPASTYPADISGHIWWYIMCFIGVLGVGPLEKKASTLRLRLWG